MFGDVSSYSLSDGHHVGRVLPKHRAPRDGRRLHALLEHAVDETDVTEEPLRPPGCRLATVVRDCSDSQIRELRRRAVLERLRVGVVGDDAAAQPDFDGVVVGVSKSSSTRGHVNDVIRLLYGRETQRVLPGGTFLTWGEHGDAAFAAGAGSGRRTTLTKSSIRLTRSDRPTARLTL